MFFHKNRLFKKTALFVLLALLAAGIQSASADSTKPLSVLLIDGQNNHKWRATTPVIVEMLESTGRFSVDVATVTSGETIGFSPDFTSYDVVFSNYNGRSWPEETRKAFVSYMKSGGGLVILHAADNSFPNWKEYNEMIGLGGWGGRNEKSGPYVYMKDNQIVIDHTPGGGGSHGAQRPYLVKTREPDHPIMKGLPTPWLHVADELYCKMRGPAKNMTILATSLSKVTNREEPVLFTIRYGKGRIFHTVLGHDAKQVKCMGCAVTLQRGTEWAATGKVTLTDVPANFPTKTETKTWISDAAFDNFKTYDFGKSRKGMAAIEKSLLGAPPAYLNYVEGKLLPILTASGTTYAGRQAILRILRRIGSAKCVPAVRSLLTDKELSHMARYVLQHLPAKEATVALLNALEKTDGGLKTGIIGSLGARNVRSAVNAIAPCAASKNLSRATAALKALGRIGGEEAARALSEADVSRQLRALKNESLLRCADCLLTEGKAEKAEGIYRAVAELRTNRPALRIAAYGGLFAASPEKVFPEILDFLQSRNEAFQDAAVTMLTKTKGSAITKKLASKLSGLPPAQAVKVISILVNRGDPAASPALRKACENDNADVQTASVKALGTLGSADVVTFLLKRSLSDAPSAGTAFESLTALSGEKACKTIAASLKEKKPALRLQAVKVLAARRETAALPAFADALSDENGDVRQEACRALQNMGSAEELPAVLGSIVETKEEGEVPQLMQAAEKIISRVENRQKATQAAVKAIRQADGRRKETLFPLLALFSTDKALTAARKGLQSDDKAIVLAAITALSQWNNPAPLGDLKKLALKGKDSSLRRVAMNGYITLLALPANRPSHETVQLFKETLPLLPGKEHKQKLIELLTRFPCRAAFELAGSFADDPALGATAKKVQAEIKKLITQKNLSATSSHNPNETRNAFDNNQSTRWTTGTPMRPGMWFVLDMGVEQAVTSLTLDTKNSAGDYPRGSKVSTSFDGKNWGKPVLTVKAQGPVTTYTFKEPVYTRFIKIEQTGSTQGLFWSIHELSVTFKE